MKQRIPCPHCGHQVRIAPWQYGQTCGCPKCQGSLQVPDLSGPQAIVAEQDRLGPRPASPKSEPVGKPSPSGPAAASDQTPRAPAKTAKSPRTTAASPTNAPVPAPQAPAVPEPPSPDGPLRPSDADPESDLGGEAKLDWLTRELGRLSGESSAAENRPPSETGPLSPLPHDDLPLPIVVGQADPAGKSAEAPPPLDLGAVVGGAPPRKPQVYQPNDPVPIVCTLCSTRFYARFSEVGEIKRCPDCFTDNVVKAPSKPPRSSSPIPLADGDSVRLAPAIDLPRYEPLTRDGLTDRELAKLRRKQDQAPPQGNSRAPAAVARMQCRQCQAIALVPPQLAGRKLSCPECRGELVPMAARSPSDGS